MVRGLALCSIACWIAGCGISSTLPADDDARDGGRDAGHRDAWAPRHDAATPLRDASTPLRDASLDAYRMDAARTCTTACTSDSQCAVTCPANPLGAQCCDPYGHRCFAATTPVCPASSYDAGHDAVVWRPDTNVDSTIDAACPPPGASGSTEVAISIPGMPGATVSIQGAWATSEGVTLDATGRATFMAPALSIGSYYGNLTVLDQVGFPIMVHVEDGAASSDLYPACVAPDPGSLEPLDRVDLVVQRDRSTGLCASSVLSVVAACVTLTGEYTASRFDDQRCGPFR